MNTALRKRENRNVLIHIVAKGQREKRLRYYTQTLARKATYAEDEQMGTVYQIYAQGVICIRYSELKN